MRRGAFRIIDANLNRSREGLRVCEEIARFVLNSGTLTKELKAIRHGISAIIKKMPQKKALLFISRCVEHDVGRSSRTSSERKRRGYADIFMANIERVKESLRVLEEVFKLFDEKGSVRFKALRFRAYDIEKRAFKKIISI